MDSQEEALRPVGSPSPACGRGGRGVRGSQHMTPIDPMTRELIREALAALGDQMSLTIVRTSHSDTVKNAMDFSSALCDARGRLIAQGLTLPNQLGSVPDAAASVLRNFKGDLHPGDLVVMNDPFDGGMHLPGHLPVQASIQAGPRRRDDRADRDRRPPHRRRRQHPRQHAPATPARSTRKGCGSRPSSSTSAASPAGRSTPSSGPTSASPTSSWATSAPRSPPATSARPAS